MAYIKFTNTAGQDIYVNPANVAYLRPDVLDNRKTQIHCNKDYHLISLPVETVMERLGVKK